MGIGPDLRTAHLPPEIASPLQRRLRCAGCSVFGRSLQGSYDSRRQKEWRQEMNEGADGTAEKAAKGATAGRSPRARKVDGEAEVLANIAAMSGSDRALAAVSGLAQS